MVYLIHSNDLTLISKSGCCLIKLNGVSGCFL